MGAKQDRVGVRSFQDVERKYNMTQIRSDIEAKTKLQIDKGLAEQGENIVSYINASADRISLKGDRFEVESTNFKLTPEGEMTANKGNIGGWVIDGTSIHSTEGIYGTYKYSETTAYNGVITTGYLYSEYTGYLFYALTPDGISVRFCPTDDYDDIYGSKLFPLHTLDIHVVEKATGNGGVTPA